MNFLYLNHLNSINSFAAYVIGLIRNDRLTEIMYAITDIGSPNSIALCCLVLLMFMWLHKKYDHATQFILTLGTAGLVTILTKLIIQLPRPDYGLIKEYGYGFASGHTLIATVFFSLIFFSYKDRFNSKLGRMSFGVLLMVITLMIGISRVYLGVHYLTDVIAGFLIGLIISGISVLLYMKHHERI